MNGLHKHLSIFNLAVDSEHRSLRRWITSSTSSAGRAPIDRRRSRRCYCCCQFVNSSHPVAHWSPFITTVTRARPLRTTICTVFLSRVGMQGAILRYQFCPSVRRVVLLYLNECKHSETFPPSDREPSLQFSHTTYSLKNVLTGRGSANSGGL